MCEQLLCLLIPAYLRTSVYRLSNKRWRKKKNETLSLFVSIFFECSQRENKFSPFWVYSQWDKLNFVRHI